MLAAVFHVIHVNTPYRYNTKLFIKDVPKEENITNLQDLLDEAGYCFGEFGMSWANHVLAIGYNSFEAQVKGAYRKGGVETISYKELDKCYDENGALIK